MRIKPLALAVPILLGLSTSQAHAGMTITPIYGTSITGNADATTIMATIQSAINVYQNSFTNPFNVKIDFEGSETTGLGQSSPMEQISAMTRFGRHFLEPKLPVLIIWPSKTLSRLGQTTQ